MAQRDRGIHPRVSLSGEKAGLLFSNMGVFSLCKLMATVKKIPLAHAPAQLFSLLFDLVQFLFWIQQQSHSQPLCLFFSPP